MSPAPTKTHLALRSPARDATSALASLREYSDVAAQRHQLPGAILDLMAAVNNIVSTAAQIDPDIVHAVERGVRSTQQLQKAEAEFVARFRAQEGRL